jgi:hypothetical protein
MRRRAAHWKTHPIRTPRGEPTVTDEPTDWVAWHEPYADPQSALSRRLRVVQAQVDQWLDDTAPRPVRVLSLCAGDGRDLLDVVRARPDAGRVRAVLVELDPELVTRARDAAREAGLGDTMEVRHGDAGNPTLWADAVPADLVLLAGIFGNVSDDDVRRTVRALPMLCAPGGRVVWTRHRRQPDLTTAIRGWFAEGSFRERTFVGPDDALFGVGVHDFTGGTAPWRPPAALFAFTR